MMVSRLRVDGRKWRFSNFEYDDVEHHIATNIMQKCHAL